MFCRAPFDPGETYKSKLFDEPEYSVLLFGAGISAPLGSPLMRGFIDRGRDFLKQGIFSDEEKTDVQATLNLYQSLRVEFSLTEEDIENVENLLSLVDLSKFIRLNPVKSLRDPLLPNKMRRFIDAVLTKSASVPKPDSPEWYGYSESLIEPYKKLIRALAYHGERLTVITLNYDCLIEYACYCMGLPFTYNRNLGPGVEILKLHGSNNWMRGENISCSNCQEIFITETTFKPHSNATEWGFLDRLSMFCEKCGSQLTPFIVPPTWIKDINNPVLLETWTRASIVLSQAETFVSIGYSLPLGDAHVRQLLNIGFASGKLRQAVILVGTDPEARQRWTNLFRESWRQSRLTLPSSYFQDAVEKIILPALNVPRNYGDDWNYSILPVSMEFEGNEKIFIDRIDPILNKKGISRQEAIGSMGILSSQMRNHRRGVNLQETLDCILAKALDWRPSTPNLPTHGNKLF